MKAIRNALVLLAILAAGYVSAQATPPSVVYLSCVVSGGATSACPATSLNAIRTVDLSSDPSVSVGGYYAPGDGGGGQLQMVASCSIAQANVTFSSNVSTVTVTSTTNILPGTEVNGLGIPASDYVTSVNSSTQVTLATPTSSSQTNVTLYFGGNGGTVFMDGKTGAPDCFQRTVSTGSVLEWGAKCDVVQPSAVLKSTSGTFPTYDLTATKGTPFSLADQGKNIVINGAGNVIPAYVTNTSQIISFAGASGATMPIGATLGSKISDTGSAIPSNTTVSAIGTFAPPGLTGDTSGTSPVINSVSSTSGVTPGMGVSGLGIPTGDTVASVGSGSITLTQPLNGSGTSGTPIAIIGQTITLSHTATATVANDSITIHGAVLATTIDSEVSNKRILLNPSNAAVQDQIPNYYAVNVKAVPNGGGIVNGGTADYMVGDQVTLDDLSTGGTVLQVQQVQNGAISGSAVVNSNGANVLTQAAISGTAPSNPRHQYMTSYRPSTGGTGGNGATFTMSYTGTGVYWFGSDDTFAIQNALNYAGTLNVNTLSSGVFLPGSDVWLPENRMCGITKTIQLPLGNTALRGWNQASSGLVALAYMPQDPTNSLDPNTYVVMTQSTTGAGGLGGGMRDLSIEGFQLADYVVGDLSGQHQTFRTVIAKDAMPYTGNAPDPANPSGAPAPSEWVYGAASGIQITGIVFDDIEGVFDFNQFPLINEVPDYAFTTKKQGTGAVISNSVFHYARIPIGDQQSDWNLYLGDYVNGSSPFPEIYCAEAGGKISIVGLECENPSSAAVHIASNSASVVDLFARWGNYLPTSTTYGVLIDGGLDYDHVTDVRTGTFLNGPANVVAMNAGVGGGTIGPNTVVMGNPGASLVVSGQGAGAIGTVMPQGRLTLQSATPVMTGNLTAQNTIYYAPYTGTYIPINSAGLMAFAASPSDTVGLTLPLDSNSAHTGYQAAGNVYDLFVGLNAGVAKLCSGPSWSTGGGSNILRGTGAGSTQLTKYSGLWSNANSMTCRFNNTSNADKFTCPQYQCTYVGSMYMTAAGQTSFNPNPAAASGGPSSPNAGIYFWNAYNRVPIKSTEQDNGTPWTCITCGSWEPADAGGTGSGLNNRINVVDGLQETPLSGAINQLLQNSSGPNPRIGIVFDSTSAAAANFGEQNSNDLTTVSTNAISLPLMGQHYAQAMQKAVVTGTANFNSNLSMTLDWQY